MSTQSVPHVDMAKEHLNILKFSKQWKQKASTTSSTHCFVRIGWVWYLTPGEGFWLSLQNGKAPTFPGCFILPEITHWTEKCKRKNCRLLSQTGPRSYLTQWQRADTEGKAIPGMSKIFHTLLLSHCSFQNPEV